MLTHRPRSSSFLGLPYRILNVNHKKELLRSLWVVLSLPRGTRRVVQGSFEAACPSISVIRGMHHDNHTLTTVAGYLIREFAAQNSNSGWIWGPWVLRILVLCKRKKTARTPGLVLKLPSACWFGSCLDLFCHVVKLVKPVSPGLIHIKAFSQKSFNLLPVPISEVLKAIEKTGGGS